jgi:hypothetical protein
VKSKRSTFYLLILVGFFSSCSKEQSSEPAIVGKWMSVSVYQEDNGQFNWLEANGFHEFVTFQADARFSIFTDVPGGKGTYVYDGAARNITLQYEDQAGNFTAAENRQVEQITPGKLVVAYFSPQGKLVNKVEYSRIN